MRPCDAALAMTQQPPDLNRPELHGRATARARLRERRTRARAIQGRIVAVTVALFFLFWAVIGVELASGHDPALTRDARLRAELAAQLHAQSPATGAGAPGSSGLAPPTPAPVLTRPS